MAGDARIDGGMPANHLALALWVQITIQTNWAFSVQQPPQPYALIVERTNPDTNNLIAEGIRLDGSVSAVLTWRVEQGNVASTPIDFSEGVLYAYGPTLGGTADPLTVMWEATKGV